MVTRLAFRGQFKKGEKEQALKFISEKSELIKQIVNENNIMTFSIFEHKYFIFVYYECSDIVVEPMNILCGLEPYLESFSGEEQKRFFVPMYDIFHYNKPQSTEKWRKNQHGTPVPRILRLKPDMIGGYIFYHHQLQEERPGCGDKYGAIYLNENLMFFYMETPEVIEPAPKGELSTNNSPDNWQEIMEEHFLPWDNGELWVDIGLVFVV